MLHYQLQRQGMLSTTGYKVLQGQKEAGLIPCYRVLYNNLDKLNYDIERYCDLESLLPRLDPAAFLSYVKNIFSILLELKTIGFLHPNNLETTLDKIFVDRENHNVHMVYLPIQETYLSEAGYQYLQNLKVELAKAIQQNANLQNDLARQLLPLLDVQTTTIEQLYLPLAELAPLRADSANASPRTVALNPTGKIGDTSRNLSTGSPVPQGTQLAPSDKLPSPQEDNKKNKQKKGFFGIKKESASDEAEQQDTGGTEVLSLFVPSIYLKGQGKLEFLIDKQEFVLGRDSSVEGTIDSTAISRKHCKITHSDNRNFVTDLDSANGTYLNGTKLESHKPRPINEGDKIKLGNIGFTVMNV